MRAFLLIALVGFASAKLDFLSDDYIEGLNQKKLSWTAGRNFPEDTPMSYIKGLMGVLPGKSGVKLPVKTHGQRFAIPDTFDAREQWPDCPTIKEIRDQGSCGSCWAVAAVSVMSDRQCINSAGKDNFRYSSEDMTSCCRTCGNGCNGGYPESAFDYWKHTGIVSGGRYNSKEGCQPYTIPECEHHTTGDRPVCGDTLPTPSCKSTCIDDYSLSYTEDRKHASDVYTFSKSVEDIQQEIQKNGPVEASFTVYKDFLSYKSGVYKRHSLEPLGGHAVRIIGWGTEGGDDYWLVANSWNSDWGDKGTFKILRGVDECGFENDIVAGTPK